MVECHNDEYVAMTDSNPYLAATSMGAMTESSGIPPIITAPLVTSTASAAILTAASLQPAITPAIPLHPAAPTISTPKLANLPTLSISGPSPPHEEEEFL